MASDVTYEVFQHYGTNAERTAFTPSPAAGTQPIYIWYETDTGNSFLYDTSWHSIAGPSGSIPTTVQGDTLFASAANTLTALAKDTNATRYLSNTGATNNPAWAQVALATGVSGDLPYANLAQGTALSVLGVTGNATADNASIVAASDFQVMRRSGTAVAFGSVNLASSNAVTGVLPVANGGSGSSSGAGVLVASGTMNNAAIKSLPTAAVEMVANPGAGFRIKVLSASFTIDTSAGAYSGVNATYSDFAIQYTTSGYWLSMPIVNDSTATTPIARMTSLFATAQAKILDWQIPYVIGVHDTAAAAGGLEYIDYIPNGSMYGPTDAVNNAVSLKATNGGVDFGSGHASNFAKWFCYYVIEAIP